MNLFQNAILGSSIALLFSTSIAVPVAAREPAELKEMKMRLRPVRLPEAAAEQLLHDFECQPNDDSVKLLNSGKLKYSRLFDAQSLDLNGDRTPELMVSGDPERQILPGHNAEVWILRKVNGKYKQILATNGSISVLKTKTAGFRDLCNAQHVSASDTEVAIYKYVRGRYKIAKCYTQTYLNPDMSSRKTPRFIKHACDKENQ